MGKKPQHARKEDGNREPSGPEDKTVNGCHCPTGCSVGVEIVDGYSEDDVVHVVCASDKCTQPTVVHTHCFDLWEQQMINLCRRAGKLTSGWSVRWMHSHVWAETWGWRIINGHCACPCGGRMRKNLDYYQMEKTKEPPKEKKKVAKAAVNPTCDIKPKKIPKISHLSNPQKPGPWPCEAKGQTHTDFRENVQGLPSKPALPVGMSVQTKKKKRRQANKSESGGQTRSDTPTSAISNTNSLIRGIENVAMFDDSLDRSVDSFVKLPCKKTLKESNSHQIANPLDFEISNDFGGANKIGSEASSVADSMDSMQRDDYSMDAYFIFIHVEPMNKDKYSAARLQVHSLMQRLTDNCGVV